METGTSRKIQELNLDIDSRGINLVDNGSKIAVRHMHNGQAINKYLQVDKFNSLEDAFIAADQYNKYIKSTKKKPRTTQQKLIEYGFSIEDDYRCVRYKDSTCNDKDAYWDVCQHGSHTTTHRKIFKFNKHDKHDAKRAMKKALEYRKEIMGDLIKTNPKVPVYKDFQKVIGKKSTGKLIKGLRFHKRKDGGISVKVAVKSKSERLVGVARNWNSFKRLVKQATKVRNESYGIHVNRISIEPAAANLRNAYLQLAGL